MGRRSQRVCLVVGCRRKLVAHGWCLKHYSWWIYGKPFSKGASLSRMLGISRQRVHQLQHPEQGRASGKVSRSITLGELHKPTACVKCGKVGLLEGHHLDYTKPLDVIWLCCECHKEIHRKNRGLTNTTRYDISFV